MAYCFAATFLFDGKTTEINTIKIPGNELTAKLEAFTIATTIQVDEFDKK